MRSFQAFITSPFTVLSNMYRAISRHKALFTLVIAATQLVQNAAAQNATAVALPQAPLPDFKLAPGLALAPAFGVTRADALTATPSFQPAPLVLIDKASVKRLIDADDVPGLEHLLKHAPSYIHHEIAVGGYYVHPWLYAAAKGSLEVIRFLFKNKDALGINVNMIGTQPNLTLKPSIPGSALYMRDAPALLHACLGGHLPIMKFLYDEGYYGPRGDDKGASCVVNTITANHHTTSIPVMKTWGLDLDRTLAQHLFATTNTNLPLKSDVTEGIKKMIAQGLDPNLSWQGQTLFDKAVSHGQGELVEILAKEKAEVKATPDSVVAAVAETAAVAKSFKRNIASTCKPDKYDCSYTRFNPETGEPLNKEANQLFKKLKIFSLLLEHNHDFKACDEKGDNPLTHLANFLNDHLPLRHQSELNPDKRIYHTFVKKILSPNFLAAIEARAVRSEIIENDEYLTCAANRAAWQAHAQQVFYRDFGALLFVLAAYVFRNQIAQIPQLLMRQRIQGAPLEQKQQEQKHDPKSADAEKKSNAHADAHTPFSHPRNRRPKGYQESSLRSQQQELVASAITALEAKKLEEAKKEKAEAERLALEKANRLAAEKEEHDRQLAKQFMENSKRLKAKAAADEAKAAAEAKAAVEARATAEARAAAKQEKAVAKAAAKAKAAAEAAAEAAEAAAKVAAEGRAAAEARAAAERAIRADAKEETAFLFGAVNAVIQSEGGHQDSLSYTANRFFSPRPLVIIDDKQREEELNRSRLFAKYRDNLVPVRAPLDVMQEMMFFGLAQGAGSAANSAVPRGVKAIPYNNRRNKL